MDSDSTSVANAAEIARSLLENHQSRERDLSVLNEISWQVADDPSNLSKPVVFETLVDILLDKHLCGDTQRTSPHGQQIRKFMKRGSR